jgi:pimeloyl-ACP methyl ester carboxylesterase/ubiquinone/menaquinone biosynthesis C-methylase UbiE
MECLPKQYEEDAMAKPQSRITDQKQTPERGNRPTAAQDARERLLAGLPVTERRLRLGGVPTAVLEGGEGPPIVLLHGPGEYGAKWLRVIPDLVTTHRVIAPDLPGHGASEVIDTPLSVDRTLAWLDDLIECTCPTPPALVGQILGGAIAARFAGERSERLSRLVLVDTLGLAAFQPTPDFGLALTEFISEPTEDTHDRLWGRCTFDLDTLRDRMGQQWEWIKAYNLDRARALNLRATQRSLMEQFGLPAIPPADLARITIPTALIWGRHDRARQLPIAQAASTRYGWRLHVIENAADDPPMEQPDAFLEALRVVLSNSSANAAVIARKRDTRAAWDKIAPGYDRTNTPTQMWIANEGLHRAGLRSGARFLDVAAGSGALSIPAARLGAQVLATDQSPAMLELLGVRARTEGLNIETRVMDGHALELDDNSFDMAGSQFGVMLFPDMPKGIREMVRVIKPGGRVLLHTYGDPHKIEFLGFLIAAVQSIRPAFMGPPMNPPPLEFQLADPDRLHSELSAAGLKDVKVETITEITEHKTGSDLWEWLVWSNPIVEMVLGMLNLTHDERTVVQQTLEKMVRERAGVSDAVRLTNPVNVGIGTK